MIVGVVLQMTKQELLALISDLQSKVDAAAALVKPTQDAFVQAINALTMAAAATSEALPTLKAAVDSLPGPVPVPDPTPLPTSLTQSVTVVGTAKVGDTVSVAGAWKNETGADVALQRVVVAVRRPGQPHSGTGATYDLDSSQVVTSSLLAGSILTGNGSFKPDVPGTYTVYPTYQDAAGTWHDGADHQVVVSAVVVVPPPVDPTPVPTPSTGMQVGTQMWFPGSDSPFVQGYNFAAATFDSNFISTINPWKPEMIATVKGLTSPGGVFRFMDAGDGNGTGGALTSWSQRRPYTDSNQTHSHWSPGASDGQQNMSYEWVIDFCNRTDINPWMCFPVAANDDYFTQAARLFKQRLKPTLKLTIEVANEIWQSGWSQGAYALQQGKAQGLSLLGTSDWNYRAAWQIKRTFEMNKIFSDVYGSEMSTRVVRVLCDSAGMAAFQGFTKMKNSTYNPAGQTVDAFCTAPYVPGGVGSPAMFPSLDAWKAGVDATMRGGATQMKALATQAGIKMTGYYEGGNQITGADAQAWAQLPWQYEAYQYLLDQYAKLSPSFVCLYTATGWDANNIWGAKQSWVTPDTDAKAIRYRAIRDWVVAHK